MDRKFLVYFLILALWPFSTAVAMSNATVCKWRLQEDFQKIHDMMPLKAIDIKRYRYLKSDIDNALGECPRAVYPIRIMGFPAGNSVMYSLSYLDLAILAQDSGLVSKVVHDKSELLQDPVAGQTPLHFAAYYGTPKILSILLRSGLAINAQDNFGHTPLMVAPGGVELNGENTRFLIEHGAGIWHVTKYGSTPLTAAIIAQDVPAVRVLLNNGALAKRMAGEVSPEFVAEKVGNKKILDILRKYRERKR